MLLFDCLIYHSLCGNYFNNQKKVKKEGKEKEKKKEKMLMFREWIHIDVSTFNTD